MEIIIIDDGVNEDCFPIGPLNHNLEVLETLEIVPRTGYDKKKLSHGSTCAGIIKKYAPYCEIGSIKVMDPELSGGTSSQLSLALEWCIKADIRLINMSLGTIDYRDFEEIRLLVARLIRNNCIIIAACHNGNFYTVPACLSGVICVASDCSLNHGQYKLNLDYLEQADVYASGRHQLRGYDGQEVTTGGSNSFAAPVVTGLVHNLLLESKTMKLCELKRKLGIAKGNPEISGFGYGARPDFIDVAIVLNYSHHKSAEKFSFRVQEWHEQPDLRQLKLAGIGLNLIILPGDIEINSHKWQQELCQLVLDYQKNINGVLYGGIMPVELKRICEEKVHCLVWDEGACQRLLGRFKTPSAESKTPVIAISGPENIVMQALALLGKKFYDNDYHVINAADIKGCYLYGMEYIPNEAEPTDIFKYWEERYDINIILFADPATRIKSPDMMMTISEDADILEFDNERITVSASHLSAGIKEIYQYVIEFFEGENNLTNVDGELT